MSPDASPSRPAPARRSGWRRGAAPVAGLALLAGCAGEPGGAEATRTTEFTVALGARTLVLDGTAGDVRVRTDATLGAAKVYVTTRARGATERSAQRRLDALDIREAGDASIHQIVWSPRDPADAEGLSADVRVALPTGAALVLHIEAGVAELQGLDGLVEVQLGEGPIRFRDAAPAPGMAWALDTGSGDVTLAFAPGARARLAAETDSGSVRLAGALIDRMPSGQAAAVAVGVAEGEALPPDLADVSVWTGRGDVTSTGGGAAE